MPTRTYYFPRDYKHLEAILLNGEEPISKSDLEYYRERGIPPIVEADHIAQFLGISQRTLYSIAMRPNAHYRNFKIRKRDGNDRIINAPRTYLKVIQWWIYDNILSKKQFPDFVFGFVPGKSAVQNASFHMGAKHLLNVDIMDFFPSISIERVENVFSLMGFSNEVAMLLASLCCLDGKLPQGAPTSPAIANCVFLSIDTKIQTISAANGYRYSRYADDLSFSCDTRISTHFVGSVAEILTKFGFELKSKKTRFAGLGNRMEVTGVVINSKLQPPKKWRKNARARMHHLESADYVRRIDIHYLYGIKGMAAQFLQSQSMESLGKTAERLIIEKKPSVLGFGQPKNYPLNLTPREAQVLSLLGPLVDNFTISKRLSISIATVKSHLSNGYKKIGVSNRRSAFVWSKQNL